MKGIAVSTKTVNATHQALGVAKTVDLAAGVITLEHAPIKTMGQVAMTTGFRAADVKLLAQRDRSPCHQAPCGA